MRARVTGFPYAQLSTTFQRQLHCSCAQATSVPRAEMARNRYQID